MWDSLIIYGLWALHGLLTLLWAHWPFLKATLTNEQEWILYLQ